MKNLVLSLGTIAYTHTISFTHIFVSRGFYWNNANFSIFRVYQPTDLAPKAPQFFLKKHYEDLCIELETVMYTHIIFEAHLRIYMPFFRNSINSSITPWIWIPKHPKLFFSKYFMRTYLLSNHHVYSHFFLYPFPQLLAFFQ